MMNKEMIDICPKCGNDDFWFNGKRTSHNDRSIIIYLYNCDGCEFEFKEVFYFKYWEEI